MLLLDPARRDELIERWARWVVGHNWGPLAIFMLEAHRPLTTLAAHGVLLAQPLVQPFLQFSMTDLASFLGDRGNIARLIAKIEQLQLQHDRRLAQRKRRKRLVRRRARRIARLSRARRRRGE